MFFCNLETFFYFILLFFLEHISSILDIKPYSHLIS